MDGNIGFGEELRLVVVYSETYTHIYIYTYIYTYMITSLSPSKAHLKKRRYIICSTRPIFPVTDTPSGRVRSTSTCVQFSLRADLLSRFCGKGKGWLVGWCCCWV